MDRSTIFLKDISVIDHAYIDDTGKILGGSYNLTVIVSGQISNTEHVVIDFSTIKTSIKNLVDAKENGFDHKLWVIPSFSLCQIITNNESIRTIKSPSFELTVPRNAVNIVNCNFIGSVLETMQRAIQQYLFQELSVIYPDVDISIEVLLNENMLTFGNQYYQTFRYVHGLKDSTSWGCQNIAHGHLSWIGIEHDSLFRNDCFDCQKGIQSFNELCNSLNNVMFIWSDNIIADNDDILEIGYSTLRGQFSLKLNRREYNIIILDVDTTIENIVGYLASKYENDFVLGHVKSLYVSEGLSKGAIKRFSY